ncbi:MAG: hypothetical protein RIT19_439 [Verrucomicrobiota bacterium]|jgi:hypothetical protein
MNTVPNAFRLYRRQPYGTFYILDVRTARPESLPTKDPKRDQRCFEAGLETLEHPEAACRLGMACLQTADPDAETRTWAHLINAHAKQRKAGSTRHRIETARRDKARSKMLNQVILRTRAEEIFTLLNPDGVSTNPSFRRDACGPIPSSTRLASGSPLRSGSSVSLRQQPSVGCGVDR